MALALVVILAITAVAGATLAYFSDIDEKENVFFSGKVDITLNEVFDKDTAQLIPGVDIQKDVTISLSEDSIESYVWYTFAIPAAIDNANGEASLNVIHVNHAGRNWLGYQNNEKYWAEGQTEATPEEDCWIIDNKVIEQIEIDGVLYNVYVVMYNGTLLPGEETTIGMTKVYCDTKVDYDNEKGVYTINGQEIGFDLNNVKIIVTAYGIQAATFETVQEAYEAYNTQADSIPVDID